MTEEQASKVLQAASGKPTGFVTVVKVSQGKYAATHAASETGELACGTWTRLGTPLTQVGRLPKARFYFRCRNIICGDSARGARPRLL